MTTLRLAWRNLWRNGRRTTLTLGAVALGAAVLVLVRGLVDGLVAGAIRNATDVLVGEVQVHAAGWLGDRALHTALRDPASLLAAADGAGVAAAARSYGHGLVAHDTRSAGALFWGVEPGRERAVSALPGHVAAGAFLGPVARGDAVVGSALARTLGVGPGDELVVVVQAADGSLGNELLRVGGVLGRVGEGVDRSAVLLHRDDFDRLFVADGRVHEVVLNGRERLPLADLAALARAAAPGADVRTWRELVPMLADMLAMMDTTLLVISGVFGLAAGLGVLNTMLMATWDRMPELGVLKAIGTAPWRLARDVTLEALLLGLGGGAAGVVLGMAVAQLLAVHGIDTRSLAGGDALIAGIPFDPVWRARPSVAAGLEALVAMSAASTAAAVWPAVQAARLRPVEAMTRV